MNQYQINLNKLSVWLSEEVKKANRPSYTDGLEVVMKDICKVESARFPAMPNFGVQEDESKIIIESRSKNYPACLAFCLMQTKPDEHLNLLQYQEEKFEFNDLIPNASFNKLLETYVSEQIKTTTFQLGWTEERVNQILEHIEAYIQQVPSNFIGLIDFDFSKVPKDDFFAELKNHVHPDDRHLVPALFGEGKLKYCLRFNISAIQLAEIFSRLIQSGIIRKGQHSYGKIAKYIQETCMVLPNNKRQRQLYTKSRAAYISNILEGKRSLPSAKKILPGFLSL